MTIPPLDQISERIRQRDLSPSDMVEGCLGRITAREPALQAWVHVAADAARREAQQLTEELRKQGPRSPLHGIPFGVKDIFDTAGMGTAWGSHLYAGRVPSNDSELVAVLRGAGAIVLGKTHTTAFAYYDAGPTRNPHNVDHTPGGSSSGSAAAVADAMAPFALGSQTQGSILRPASFCGVVGLKPTFGALPLGGVLPFAKSLDHAGLFTRTAPEMAFLWSALFPPEAHAAPQKSLSVAPWPPDGGVESQMESAFAACCRRLAESGFSVLSVQLPPSFRDLPGATRTVNKFEGAHFHRERFEHHGAQIGAKLVELVREGLALPEETYEEAKRVIERARGEYAGTLADHPIWLTPAAPGPAPQGLHFTGDPRCNLPFTALGAPAISLPFGSAAGLPLGLQLTGGRGREQQLLATAVECERALRGHGEGL